ncbi:MAG: PilZ domain-containing protein [Thermoanaerobaculia bacterium]
MSDERRQFQRLNLTDPIDGHFDLLPVRILDVSATGGLLLHEGTLAEGARGLLRFPWRGEEILVVAEVRRSDEGRSGLEFVADSEPLRAALVASVQELLRAQEANAEGDRERNVISGDETITAAAGMRAVNVFVSYRLTDAGWKRQTMLLPDQPDDGFTVAASVPDEDITSLCRAYEMGDEEGRRLTRLLAELSVGVPR